MGERDVWPLDSLKQSREVAPSEPRIREACRSHPAVYGDLKYEVVPRRRAAMEEII